MAFVQIIEFTTTRPDEVEALVGEWRSKTSGGAEPPNGAPSRRTETARIPMCRSWSSRPTRMRCPIRTSPGRRHFAQSLAELCDGPMVFRNLDVRSVEEM